MNELKPEDVRRALEKHADYENDNCFECPYKNHLSTEVGNCVDHLVRDALALLREKDAEIERLKSENEYLEKVEQAFNDCVDQIQKDQAEVKYLKHTIRADAITEFAELWKKWWYGQIQVAVNEYQESIIYDAIDQIANEMKGETFIKPKKTYT